MRQTSRAGSGAVLVLLAAAVGAAPAPTARPAAPAGCAGAVLAGGALRPPSLAQLQAWTREYYPSLAAGARAPARLVVGFVVDERCAVRRHSAGFRPAGAYSEDVVLSLFPGLTRRGEPAGLGDAVPPDPRVRDGRHGARLVVSWLMQPGGGPATRGASRGGRASPIL